MKFYLFLLFLLTSIFSHSQFKTELVQVDSSFKMKDTLNGKIIHHLIQSKYLAEPRTIDIYLPKDYSTSKKFGVLVVTDGICEIASKYIEPLIEAKKIKPIIIVGINHRKKQPIDSLFNGQIIDFRRYEYIENGSFFSADEHFFTDSLTNKIIRNRFERYTNYLINEVIPFLKENYSVTKKHQFWTIGGFSNGGAVVANISLKYPTIFGNVIIMSPGGSGSKVQVYNYKNAKRNKFYIASGKKEEGFYKESIAIYSELLNENANVSHTSYPNGHEWEMWIDFYLHCLIKIY